MGSAWSNAFWLLNPKQIGNLTEDIVAGYLGNQARDWNAAPFASSIPSYCAYENRPTLGKIVVSMESATYLCTRRSEGVDANHSDIVKPKDRASQPYAFFKANFISAFENLTAHSLPEPSPVIVVDCHLANLPNIMPSNGVNELDLVYTPGDDGGGPIGTGGKLNQSGERLTWSTDLIGFPVMYCELTTESKPLYSVTFDLHLKFNTVDKNANGQIGPGQLLKERDWPIGVTRLSNTYSFGFYAFTTGQYMVFATFPSTAQYLDPNSNNRRAARLVVVNWQALSFAPAVSIKSVPTSP